MAGDAADMLGRLKAVLPSRWFGDSTPVLDGLLSGLAAAWVSIYALLQAVRGEARIGTASGQFLDAASADYFGYLPRWPGEADDSFRRRIQQELLRPRTTRAALALALDELTGRAPLIFEPARAADTGAWNTGVLAWGMAGGYGSLLLPYQAFITAYRPHNSGIADIAGYGTGGPLAYASLAMIEAAVTDADINASIARVLPLASIGWTRISS